MRKTILSGLIAATLLAVLLNLPVLAQGITNFSNLVLSGDLTVGDDATVADTLTAADVTTSDDLTVGDDLTVADDATVTGDLTLGQQSVITLTQAGTLTPTGSYQQITAAGAVSFGSIVAGTAGDVLTLVNIGSNSITITDTGTLKLSGNAALGQYDTILLLSDGTNWIQISPEGDN